MVLHTIFRYLLAAYCFACWGATPAGAAEITVNTYDICAKGLSTQPERPFSRLLRVHAELTGAVVDAALRDAVLAQLVQKLLWPRQADQVFVEDLANADCAAALGEQASISVALTDDDLAAIRAEIGRGPGVLPAVDRLARRAVVGMDQASTGPADQRQWLRVYYASNRNARQQPATSEAFGTERVDSLSYGSVEVSVRPQPRMKDLTSPATLRFDGATSLDDFAAAGNYTPLSLDQWRRELGERARRFDKPGILLFVHGYNVNFVDAARRSAQLAYDLAFPGPTVFLAWPSDASVIQYLDDGRDAENSWSAAAEVLAQLTSLLPDGPVTIVAHSMGNRVMLGGLVRLLDQSPGKRRAIRSVVMAAPDVDQDYFRLNWAPKLLHQGIPFTLYASDRDLALGASEFLQGGKRLGMGGKALLALPGVDAVDASGITRAFFALNHSYFGDKTAVLSDLFHVIRLGLPPEKRPHLSRIAPAPVSQWVMR